MTTAERMERRAEMAVRAAEMRRAGKLNREIAEALGVSASYVSQMITDPDGTKDRERKKRYAGTCRLCGGPTAGQDGRAKAPTVCKGCLSGLPWWARSSSPPDRRRRYPVRLVDIPVHQRLAAVEEVAKIFPDYYDRDQVFAAAIWPDPDFVAWVSSPLEAVTEAA